MRCFYKRFGDYYWNDVSKSLENLPQWDVNLGTELLEFDITLIDPVDNNNEEILVSVGDDICITNDSRTEVIGGVLAGVIVSVNLELIGFDKGLGRWIVKYGITVRNRDFSLKFLNFNIRSPTSLNDILDMIFIEYTDLAGNKFVPSVSNTSDGVLSGYTGGVINSVTIDKYVNLGSNVIIDSFEVSNTPLNCLVELLNSIGYFFRVFYFVEPDSVRNINLVQQYQIFSRKGIDPTDEWMLGIDNKILRTGYINNLDYISEYDTPNVDRFLPAEHTIGKKVDITNIVNYSILDTVIVNNTDLVYQDFIVKGNQSSFELDSIATDIVYYCRLVTSRIISVTSDSVFSIEVPKAERILYDQSKLLNDRLVCRLISGSNAYFRPFTISSNTITLDTPVPGLNTSFKFELANGVDIYPDDYPNLDVVQYGVRKKVRARERGFVQALPLDVPNNGDIVRIWYYRAIQEKKVEDFSSDIIKYGMFFRSEVIDRPITEDTYYRLKRITELNAEPNIEITFTSYRKSQCQIGYKIPVVIENNNGKEIIKNTSAIVTSIKNRFISQNNIEQVITISNMKYRLQDIIKQLKTASNNKNPLITSGNDYKNLTFSVYFI